MTASWGSPYPKAHSSHLRRQSFSSEPSEDSPIHQLEIQTPFLRPPPDLSPGAAEPSQSLVSAAVLANRARRPASGLTEDWIRQHTAADHGSERQLWLSDGTGDSEHSSLSGSASGDEASWLRERHLETPRALPDPRRESRRPSKRYPRARSSIETLKQADIARRREQEEGAMEGVEMDKVSHDGKSDISMADVPQAHDAPNTPKREPQNGAARLPSTPIRGTPSRTVAKEPTSTPRLKKKVPWKGKNIMVFLPRDDQRGRPGQGRIPLNGNETHRMFRSWEELGYDISGFDLEGDNYSAGIVNEYSQSRAAWPDFDEVVRDRAERHYKVALPDLNGKDAHQFRLEEPY